MRDDLERLRHILDAITKIEKYAIRGKESFDRDELIQNWILNHLQIIGEACNHLSNHFIQQHPELPWRWIIGMRNILVHHYFEIDLELVWSTLQNDLPTLKRNIETIINDYD